MIRMILGMLVCATLYASPGFAEDAVKNDGSVVTFTREGRFLFDYKYSGVPFKPYVRQFATPSGINLLRDAPSDHLHHHALMFAIFANDVDFWIESQDAGYQVHKEFDKEAAQGLAEKVEWKAQKDAKKSVLLEKRTIRPEVTSNPAANVLTWRTELSVPPTMKEVTLKGSHYTGLGTRFVEAMDGNVEFLNSTGQPGDIVRGEERNVKAKWCACTSKVDGKPVTAIIFDAPTNVRHPATFFTMPRGFAYLSVTLGLDKEPFVIESGKPLVLTYGVAVCDGTLKASEIDALYSEWTALAAK